MFEIISSIPFEKNERTNPVLSLMKNWRFQFFWMFRTIFTNELQLVAVFSHCVYADNLSQFSLTVSTQTNLCAQTQSIIVHERQLGLHHTYTRELPGFDPNKIDLLIKYSCDSISGVKSCSHSYVTVPF